MRILHRHTFGNYQVETVGRWALNDMVLSRELIEETCYQVYGHVFEIQRYDLRVSRR